MLTHKENSLSHISDRITERFTNEDFTVNVIAKTQSWTSDANVKSYRRQYMAIWYVKIFEKIFGARCKCGPVAIPKRKKGRPRKSNIGG